MSISCVQPRRFEPGLAPIETVPDEIIGCIL